MSTDHQIEALNHRCENCPFGQSRVVKAELRPSPLLIVGEAPAHDEVRTGKPFTGPSGKLLWQIFSRLGIEREQVAVTNSLRCMIPSTQDKTAGNLKHACLACRGRLLEEIEEVNPKVILALGNTAMHTVLADFKLKITQQRGKAVKWGERLVVPTLHPAAILRNPVDFKKLAADLGYVVSLLNGGTVKDPGETKFMLIKDEEGVARAIEFLSKQRILAADIETSDVNPRKHWIQYLGVSWEKNRTAIFPASLIPLLAPLFESPTITWVWHNGKFDTSFLQELGLAARTDEDTMLLHYVLDENRGTHDLKQLAADLLGAEDYDAVLKRYVGKGENGWANIPAAILIPYLARDADYTGQIYPILRERVRKVPALNTCYEDVILPSSHFLQRVERNGIWVSLEHLETVAFTLATTKDEIESKIQEIVEDIWDPDVYAEAVGSKSIPAFFNPGSPRQVSWLIYDRLKLRVPGKQGVRDTAEETLRNLPSHPLVVELLKLRKVAKALGTYAEGVLREVEADGRVHSTYLIHGTATGRLSSRGPNMQNIPRDALIRDIFQAPPGRILVDTDFDQAELRMLAHLSGDEELLRIYLEGRKLHDEVAMDMFGPNYTDEQRMRAKAINFGIVYGRTEFSLMHEFKISLIEAKRMVHEWFARFPQAKAFIESCRNAPLQGKVLQSPFGRQRRFPLVPEMKIREIQNEAANFPVQSGASDLTLLTAMAAEPFLTEIGALIVNLVHDSILVECDHDRAITDQVLMILQSSSAKVVKERLRGKLDFPMDAKIGQAWGSAVKGDKWWEIAEMNSSLG